MSGETKKTALYDVHKKLNGNIVDFHGTLLPVLYSSIQEEHTAVRENVGIFDVSHMGNIIIETKSREEAVKALNYLLPNDYSKIAQGKVIYGIMLNEKGTIIDDLMVMSITETLYHIIVNASNIEKDFKWMKSKIGSMVKKIENKSDFYGIIAVQGPNAYKLIQNEFNIDVSNLKFSQVALSKYKNQEMIVSRTGYTGEDGFELIISNEFVVALFEDLLLKGKKYNMIPCGLGSRDTLRLEAGLPLYGQELDEEHSPLQTNMAWSVKLNKPDDFIGKKATQDEKRFAQKLTGFEVLGKSIPRTGMEIFAGEKKVGTVTSGTFSPTLKKNIGVAFIDKEYLNKTDLTITVRNKSANIVLIDLPFYKRKK